MSVIHKPVLLNEVLDFWRGQKGGWYIDATIGLGGHAEALLKKDDEARCLGMDVDPQALEIARERLKPFGTRVELLKEDYRRLPEIMRSKNMAAADGILIDCGVSSLQLDQENRGFSFLRRGPLDMRMDSTQGETALELIQRLPVKELSRIILDYGEEPRSWSIAKALKNAASNGELIDTVRSAEIVAKAAGGRGSKKIHPATKTFQSLRIAVNRELENLKIFLKNLPSLLSPNGRFVAISFHSLEDRLVKESMRAWSKGCVCPPDFPKCVCGRNPEFKILTKKAVTASEEEVSDNPRSRSAKLRAVEKC